ncbi:hypothetical protein CEXT_269671 [Caerostris extrusa]|uniref:Uncharacterized protein n=1 Tax=Caerostris extrusa TaxID=172846 RepID=A0AAV4XZZ3_CAEEX|nr:hypothetical protein CEXT_269671 [Caerostris extrusa]
MERLSVQAVIEYFFLNCYSSQTNLHKTMPTCSAGLLWLIDCLSRRMAGMLLPGALNGPYRIPLSLTWGMDGWLDSTDLILLLSFGYNKSRSLDCYGE